MRYLWLIVFVGSFSGFVPLAGCSTPEAPAQVSQSALVVPPTNDDAFTVHLLASLERKSLDFFLDNYAYGLYLDKSSNLAPPLLIQNHRHRLDNEMASLAVTGFGSAVLAHAAQVGLVPASVAAQRLAETFGAIRLMIDKGRHFHGWLYHFVTASADPDRFGRSEFSTVDTALLYWGTKYAAEALAPLGYDYRAQWTTLVGTLDWDIMRTNGGALPNKQTLSMGFSDGKFIPYNWDRYNETPLLVMMGIGLDKLSPSTWWAWERQSIPTPFGPILAGDESLFMHQFFALYVGNTRIDDGFPSYYQNSIAATRYNKWFTEQPQYKPLYGSLWGLSATLTPDGGYFAYGPREPRPGVPHSRNDNDGTVCLGAAFSSLPLDPTLVLDSMKIIMSDFEETYLIGHYGFYESVNAARHWRSDKVIGLSPATVYPAIAAYKGIHAMDRDVVKWDFVRNALAKISAYHRDHIAIAPF